MTLLSQQLQKLALPQDKVRSGAIQHASLIFSSRVASDYDIQDIYDIGVNGLEELVALNPCFARFKDSLFHQTSAKFERLIKTSEVLESVDREIELFLAFVSNYSLLSPAHKALEWLIRAYKVHLYNAEALLTAFIPLHDSKVFAKLLEITTLPDNWKWLEPAKSSNVNISREDLVKLCVSNPHYLIYFIESSLKIVDMTDNQSRIHHSFLVTLVYLVLDRFDEVPQNIVPKLYGCIITAVSSDNKNLKSVGYIIVGQVVRTLTLKDKIVRDLITVICDKADPTLAKELLLTICCILHHLPLDDIPASAVERVLEEDYFVALQLVYAKSDISLFMKVLLNTMLDLSIRSGVLLEEKYAAIFELPEFPPSIAQQLCEKYFDRYFAGDSMLRESLPVKKLGDILATYFPDEMQNMFEKSYKSGCDMEVLEGLKSLILSKYLGTDTAAQVMEVHHALPGIRMLGLLKISEKLASGSDISEEERIDIVNSLICRISDEDTSVCLKSLSLLHKIAAEGDIDNVLQAVLQNAVRLTSRKSCDKDSLVELVTSVSKFPVSPSLNNTLVSLLINTAPLLDTQHKNAVSSLLKANSDLTKLAKVINGNEWNKELCKFILGLPNRLEMLEVLVKVPTRQHFVVLCMLGISGSLNQEEYSLVCGYLVGILSIALDRKSEYKEYNAQHLMEVITTKAVKFYTNYDIMKREWEMTGLVTQVLGVMGAYLTQEQDMNMILTYLMRYAEQYHLHKQLVAALDKATLYNSAMKVILAADPNTALCERHGLSTGLDNLLEMVKVVKIAESDLVFVTPYLLSAFVSPSAKVKSWSYKRLKTISKMGVTTPEGSVLNQLQLSKDTTLGQLQQELKRVCSSNTTPDTDRWLSNMLPRGSDIPAIYNLLFAVQHPVKLRYALSLLKGEEKARNSSVLGELTSETVPILDTELLALFSTILNTSTNKMVLIDSINTEFLVGLSSDVSADIIASLVRVCQETSDQHLQLQIRQKLVEVGVELTLPVFLTLLRECGAINVHIVHVLNMQGAASEELATVLFELLESDKVSGAEEDMVTLLTSISTQLGAQTPVSPAALRAVVQVIRQTNKQTNRHTLHHNCLVLLSKLAVHFPTLVLDHVMSIFTFMGDNTMRMDDSYSIQVLMETISTVIPVINKKKDMMGILRVFCDTLPHIPSHRQDPVFDLLLHTSTTAHLYHVFLFVLELCSREREQASQFSYFLQNLSTHFDLSELLRTASGLVKTLATLPDKLHTPMGGVHKITVDSGIELQFKDKKHYNYFKLGLATQIYLLTSNKHFIGLLAKLEDCSNVENEKMLAEVIEISLSILIHSEVVFDNDKFTEMLCKRLSGVITSVTTGLPSKLFISVMTALLSTDTSLVHTKTLHILLTKVTGRDVEWTAEFEENIIDLSETLLNLSEKYSLTWKVLEHIVKRIGTKHADKCEAILKRCIVQLDTVGRSPELRGCLSVCVGVLGVRTVPHLQELTPIILRDISGNGEILRMIISTVPQFLSAQLPDILVQLSANLEAGSDVVAGCELIGERVNMRVLLPALVASVDKITSTQPTKLGGITTTLTQCIKTSTTQNLKTHLTVVSQVFTKLLNYRDANSNGEIEVEKDVIVCFLHLVYKLTEKEFLPLLLQLLDWSTGSVERATTFYHLAAQLSDKLQGLFLLFGGSLFIDMVSKLKESAPQQPDVDEFESKKQKRSGRDELVNHILFTLHNILKYDTTHSFTTPDRFDTLLPVLLDLIPGEVPGLSAALSELPIAANTERLWKQFNYQLLNLSKSDNVKVRQRVVLVYREFITKLGQDYSVLLSDSIPFISELLEDTDSSVEDTTHTIVKTIQDITGESLEQYL